MSTETEHVGGDAAVVQDGAGDGVALSLDHVVKRFGEVVAVDGISFDVGRREFFSLLGPSGCGKTTTLRMLAGFETPTEGRILVDGRDASRLAPHERDTNMVFQSYALFPHMTVAQNVAFGPQRKKLSRKEVEQRVQESLSAVRLEGYGKRYPRELSGGQAAARRARARAGEPTVGAAARRAARCPRPQAARGDAVRAQAHPARGRDQLRVRHPRPGRGA